MDFIAWDCTNPEFPVELMLEAITRYDANCLTLKKFQDKICEFARAGLAAMKKTEQEVDVSMSFEADLAPIPFNGTIDAATWSWAEKYIRDGRFNFNMYFVASELQTEADRKARAEEWKAFAAKRKQNQKESSFSYIN